MPRRRCHNYISGWSGGGRPRWPEGFSPLVKRPGTRPGEPNNHRRGHLETMDMNFLSAPCSIRQHAERLKLAHMSTNPVVGSCSNVGACPEVGSCFFWAAISKALFPVPSVLIS